MELIADQLEHKNAKLEKELRYWTEVLQKSEKYERLKDNEDWQMVLKEMGHVVDVHKKEIENALDSLTVVKPSERDQVNDLLFVHQIRKEQIAEALKEPERILSLAKHARERIPEIKEEMRTVQEDLSHA